MKQSHAKLGLLFTLIASSLLSWAIADKVSTRNMTTNNLNEKCPFEYGECPNPDCSNYHSNTLLRDYQIELYMDTVWVYDGRRLVGKCVDTTWSSPLMKIFQDDNQ